MCEWKSAIVDRTGKVHHHWCTDSHEEIVAIFGLRDDRDHICRVEYSSTTGDVHDINTYALKVDESDAPGWWTVEIAERAEKELRSVVERSIITEDRPILLPGVYILGEVAISTLSHGVRIINGGNARINQGRTALVQRGNSMTVQHGDSMTVQRGDSMTVTYGDSMTVKNGGSMTVKNGNSMTVTYGNSMTVTYGGSMTVTYGDSMTVKNGNSMTVQRGDSMTVLDKTTES